MKEFPGYKRGINLGGWLSQCVHTKEHYDSFITEDDISRITSWKLDHVRLPIDYNLIQDENGGFIEEGFGYIDSCVIWCRKYHLNMIIDLHRAAGYFFDDSDDNNTFFRDVNMQMRFYELWSRLAERYGKYDNIAFELLNEIVDENVAEQWNLIAAHTVAKIREHAPDRPIIIGGVNSNSVASIPGLDLPYDENIVYNFHFYEPLIFTHQSAYWIDGMPGDFTISYPCSFDETIKYSDMYLPSEKNAIYNGLDFQQIDISFMDTIISKAAQIAVERNVPLYCGEYGVIDLVDIDCTMNWYRDLNHIFNKYGIGRAAWNYKCMDFGLTSKHYDDVRSELLALL